MKVEVFAMNSDSTNRPLAAKGLTSYRCKGLWGWIMIGAKDHHDAWREAQRSGEFCKRSTLQIWDGKEYVPVNNPL